MALPLHLAQLLLEIGELVAEPRGELELELRGRGVHLVGEPGDELGEVRRGRAQRAPFGRAAEGGSLRPPSADLAELIAGLTDQMHTAAAELQFELAARLRDELADLKKELRQMQREGHG